MRRFCVMACTGGWPTFPVETLITPGFKVGQHWEDFGIKLTPGEPLTGQSILDLAKQHEYVALQHHAPADFIKRLKDLGCKVLLWLDYEAMPATEYWSPAQKDLWRFMTAYRLTGTKHNRFMQQWVDLYESSDNGPYGKPHCWAMNLFHPQYDERWIQVVGDEWAREGYRGLVDGIFLDSILERPYYGTASNAPTVTKDLENAYVASWRSLLKWTRILGFGEVWGNCGAAVNLYPELHGKWDESFISPWTSSNYTDKLQKSMEGAAKAGNTQQKFVINLVQNSTFLEDEEKQWTLLAQLSNSYPNRVGVCTARTGYQLFLPPGTGGDEGAETKAQGGQETKAVLTNPDDPPRPVE